MSDKKITIEEVKHIAKLSKLNISDNELDFYVSEMNKMINHFKIISKVDTSKTEPMTHVGNIINITEKDNQKTSLNGLDVIKNSPDTFGRFIKIPKILD